MEFVNLTPHNFVVFAETDTIGVGFRRTIVEGAVPVLVVEPSGSVPRAREIRTELMAIDGIPVVSMTYGELTGMPEMIDPEKGYIVSALCIYGVRALGYDNFYTPADLVRAPGGKPCECCGKGGEGMIVGALGLSKI